MGGTLIYIITAVVSIALVSRWALLASAYRQKIQTE